MEGTPAAAAAAAAVVRYKQCSATRCYWSATHQNAGEMNSVAKK